MPKSIQTPEKTALDLIASIMGVNVTNVITSVMGRIGRVMTKQPVVERACCTNCGLCAKACPFDAIDPASLEIDESTCIRCFACVRICPTGARKITLMTGMNVSIPSFQ